MGTAISIYVFVFLFSSHFSGHFSVAKVTATYDHQQIFTKDRHLVPADNNLCKKRWLSATRARWSHIAPSPSHSSWCAGAFLEARRDRSFDWLGDGGECEDTNLRALLSSPSPSIISFEGIAQTAPSPPSRSSYSACSKYRYCTEHQGVDAPNSIAAATIAGQGFCPL